MVLSVQSAQYVNQSLYIYIVNTAAIVVCTHETLQIRLATTNYVQIKLV